jgi:hypothetical protein
MSLTQAGVLVSRCRADAGAGVRACASLVRAACRRVLRTQSMLVFRGHKVLLDADLAALYGVPHQAIK